jgi:hypothetical protein
MICMFYNCRNGHDLVKCPAVGFGPLRAHMDGGSALGGLQRRPIPSVVYHVRGGKDEEGRDGGDWCE